jgi:hypothetical protein
VAGEIGWTISLDKGQGKKYKFMNGCGSAVPPMIRIHLALPKISGEPLKEPAWPGTYKS